jgi:ATP-dependent Clp protease ATP-binding subunit ClpA
VFDRFDDESKAVFDHARRHAVEHGHELIAPEHLLLGLLDVEGCQARALLESMSVSIRALRAELLQRTRPPGARVALHELSFTPQARHALELVLEEAALLGRTALGTAELLIALARVEGATREVLLAVGVEERALRERARGKPETGEAGPVLRRRHPQPSEPMTTLLQAAHVLRLLDEPGVAEDVLRVARRLRPSEH